MAGYSPLKITGMETGLVQQREEFILPNDAYPNLQNAYVWRERILRKKGYELLGRLQREETVAGVLVPATNPADGTINLRISLPLENTASIVPGSVNITIAAQGTTYTDPSMNGTLTATGGTGTGGTINYATSVLTINLGNGLAIAGTIQYYPGLPVMGIRIEELPSSANDRTIFFDQVYAYVYDQPTMAFKEFIPGTTWNANNNPISSTDFFWSTNYWVSSTFIPGTVPPNTIPFFTTNNIKLFWVTNNSAGETTPDPIRITDGSTWVDFRPPNFGQIDATNYLLGCLAFLPFRGRMVAFNTYEGPSIAGSITGGIHYSNRIRWATIGNPFIAFTAGPPATGSWRSDIRGQGGFLDIPTSEDIVSVGFVRDNLVIYCERSTWQLRYTGRTIAPFQIEKVNSELGGEGPFSSVQFDTSLMTIGDKGIIECDSYQAHRVDIKIPDFVFDFQAGTGTGINQNNAPFRVHGIREFINRLAYWTIPYAPSYDANLATANKIFPNQRLVYNYENDSWALFNDSLTTIGNYQPQSSRTWLNTHLPWIRCNFNWINASPAEIPSIVGGNQQGFIEYLDTNTTNDPSLYIAIIQPNAPDATIITSPSHNMSTGFVIEISGIPIGTPYANLNSPQAGLISNITQANPAQVTSIGHSLKDGDQIEITDVVGMIEVNDMIFTVTVIDADNFTIGVDSTAYTAYISGGTWTNQEPNVFSIVFVNENRFSLWKYDPTTGQFSTPQIDATAATPYVGGGVINIRENFSVLSKKFNFLDEGQNIQLGYLDILMEATGQDEPGAISLNVYLDYDGNAASNTSPQNEINDYSPIGNPDTFFNSVIPTSQSGLSNIEGSKFWQRVYCATRSNFLTLEYTFSNAQMAGIEQEQEVQIDAQVLWIRKAGRMTQI